jgi:helicase required for RNAi-mediated heterochromatin assembly 1
MCKLRSGCSYLEKADTSTRLYCSDANIYPKSRIYLKWQEVWRISCPIIFVKLNTSTRHFFNGQLVCFTSGCEFNDLIVATILRNSQIDALNDEDTAIIEIIKMENITDIFDRDLFMLEAKSYFDPYHQVFAALKNLNEYNFPFKNRIIKVQKDCHFPRYQHSNLYAYKNYSIRPDSLSEWLKYDLKLENMQVHAVHSAVSNDFSLIVGPPGTGKTFIGLEILKILLENTNEKILILTQTNTALDKFLIGALNFTNDIVRLGGQCHTEALFPYLADNSLPMDTKSYLKKLHYMQKKKVNDLIAENSNEMEIFKQISKHYRLTEEANQLKTFCNVNSKRVFGMTTSFSAHNSSINKMLKAGIVIIEEASEILESHVVASLTTDTKHVIMIGDHQQLRPQINSYALQKKFNFNISLFERLIKNNLQNISLDVQMRMRPEFCDLLRESVYFNLKDGENVLKYPNVKGMKKNFLCFSHHYPENSAQAETSKHNEFEVDFLINLYEKLIDSGNESGDIVILTSYAAQAKKFKEKLKNSQLPYVRVAILDAYQGEESNIILLSLVRSNKSNEIGFMSFENRVSVLLSRAKIGFYICGNLQCFANSSKMWKNVMKVLVRHDALESDLSLNNI